MPEGRWCPAQSAEVETVTPSKGRREKPSRESAHSFIRGEATQTCFCFLGFGRFADYEHSFPPKAKESTKSNARFFVLFWSSFVSQRLREQKSLVPNAAQLSVNRDLFDLRQQRLLLQLGKGKELFVVFQLQLLAWTQLRLWWWLVYHHHYYGLCLFPRLYPLLGPLRSSRRPFCGRRRSKLV